MIMLLKQYAGRLLALVGLVVCITLFLVEPLTQHFRFQLVSLIGVAFTFLVTAMFMFMILVIPEEPESEKGEHAKP